MMRSDDEILENHFSGRGGLTPEEEQRLGQLFNGGKLPTANFVGKTPEEEANYIVSLVNSGAKLDTGQLIALQLTLDSLQSSKNNQLKERARNILETGVQQLNGTQFQAYQNKVASLQREGALNWQATANDIASLGELKDARAGANTADDATIAGLGNYYGNTDTVNRGLYAKYADDIAGLNDVDTAALGKLYSETGETNAANQRSVQGLKGAAGSAGMQDVLSLRELAALNKGAQHIEAQGYNDITGAGAAPTFQYNKELARQQEEQDRRAALEATLRDLGSRGIRSGGAEIGALLGSEQNTARTRATQDMQALALSGQMTDAVSQFNAAQGQTAKRFQDELNAQQEKERLARGERQVQTGLDTTEDIYKRAGQVYEAETGTNQTNLGNTKGAYDATADRTDTMADRAKSVTGTGLDVSDTGAQLAKDLAEKEFETTEGKYGRNKDVVGVERDVTDDTVERFKDTEGEVRKNEQENFGNATVVQDALTGAESVGITGQAPPLNLAPKIGEVEERRAEGMIDDKQFNPLDPSTW